MDKRKFRFMMDDSSKNRDYGPFSNPLPPSKRSSRNEDHGNHRPMSNEDFRKLWMTPRAGSIAPIISEEDPSHAPYYATLNHQQEDKLAELAQKYRDRAKERRDGANPDYQNEDPVTSAAEYRAVAPDVKSGMDAAERRWQMIQESKFLGGDMKHTHLVKGLDYALLQKVRSEIHYKEKEEEETESLLLKHNKVKGEEEEEIQFRTKLGKNIYRQVFKQEEQYSEKSDLFLPNRMVYIYILKNENAESDVPTTLLRSKADCPSLESQTTLTTNDIVINKVIEVFSNLRLQNKRGKRKDKDTMKEEHSKKPKVVEDSIFGDIGEYVPVFEKRVRKSRIDKNSNLEKKSYFEKRESNRKKNDKYCDSADNEWGNLLSEEYEDADDHGKEKLVLNSLKGNDSCLRAKLSSKLGRDMTVSYAECYPGAPENEDAMADSDDEVDYSKMDMGNKKGPVGRWDFDTAEEYSDYMSCKEALPKAAFQYGVKMADGRKTRRTGTGKMDEKTKLDRELQRINQINAHYLDTQKDLDSYGSGGGTPEYKRPRYQKERYC